MRKANYDKFPSTKLTGMLVQGWDSIISMLKKKMDIRITTIKSGMIRSDKNSNIACIRKAPFYQ